MPRKSPPSRRCSLSRTGFDDCRPFITYHQGGLDCYCAIYAIFNLINYLKWREDRKIIDYVGQHNFECYRTVNSCGAMVRLRNLLQDTSIAGCETNWLRAAIGPVLTCCGIRSASGVVEDEAIAADADENRTSESNFRIGIAEYFATSQPILGFACVMEGDADTLQHWVVFVEEVGQSGAAERGGLVLDSDRGYRRWTYVKGKLKIFRSDNEVATPWVWLSSFIAVQIGA